jgi:hypothetical protein
MRPETILRETPALGRRSRRLSLDAWRMFLSSGRRSSVV